MASDKKNHQDKEPQPPLKADSAKKEDPTTEQPSILKEYPKDERGEKKGEKMVSLKESDYQKLRTDLAEYKDKYLRLYAEFDNARKRMERERLDFVQYANEELLGEFLNISDDLERSMEAAKARHEDYSAFITGIEMVMAHIYEMLKRNHVKPVESLGKRFDPHCHEILMLSESDEAEEGTVLQEFQKGYLMGDRVIRTAKVKVAKKKSGQHPEEISDQHAKER